MRHIKNRPFTYFVYDKEKDYNKRKIDSYKLVGDYELTTNIFGEWLLVKNYYSPIEGNKTIAGPFTNLNQAKVFAAKYLNQYQNKRRRK